MERESLVDFRSEVDIALKVAVDGIFNRGVVYETGVFGVFLVWNGKKKK